MPLPRAAYPCAWSDRPDAFSYLSSPSRFRRNSQNRRYSSISRAPLSWLHDLCAHFHLSGWPPRDNGGSCSLVSSCASVMARPQMQQIIGFVLTRFRVFLFIFLPPVPFCGKSPIFSISKNSPVDAILRFYRKVARQNYFRASWRRKLTPCPIPAHHPTPHTPFRAVHS